MTRALMFAKARAGKATAGMTAQRVDVRASSCACADCGAKTPALGVRDPLPAGWTTVAAAFGRVTYRCPSCSAGGDA